MAKGSAKFGSGERNRDQGSATPQSKSETPSMWEVADDQGLESAHTSGGQWSSEVGISSAVPMRAPCSHHRQLTFGWHLS